MKNIIIIGHTGVGKTTFGKNLALKMDFDFFDLDVEVEKRLNSPIHISYSQNRNTLSLIFSEVFSELLQKKNSIISTGGFFPIASFYSFNNLSNIIFLNISLDFYFERILNLKKELHLQVNKNRRILFKSNDNIKKTYFLRNKFYKKIVENSSNSFNIPISSNSNLDKAVEDIFSFFSLK